MGMHYTVYKTTNSVNGKFYIGVHATENPDDSYLGSGKVLRAAVKKYGRAAFTKEILFDFDNRKEMEDKEREIVNHVFLARGDVYNLIPGGGDVPQEVRSQAGKKGIQGLQRRLQEDTGVRENQRDAAIQTCIKNLTEGRFKPLDWTGRQHTEATKLRMRRPRPNTAGEGNSQFGTVWICKPGDTPRKVARDLLPVWLSAGWTQGRKT